MRNSLESTVKKVHKVVVVSVCEYARDTDNQEQADVQTERRNQTENDRSCAMAQPIHGYLYVYGK